MWRQASKTFWRSHFVLIGAQDILHPNQILQYLVLIDKKGIKGQFFRCSRIYLSTIECIIFTAKSVKLFYNAFIDY